MLSLVLRLLVGLALFSCSETAKTLNVTTYNVGLVEAIPALVGVTIDREVRRNAIIEALRSSDADHICMQEVWFVEDVVGIVNGVNDVFPHSFSESHNAVPADGDLCNLAITAGFLGCLQLNCAVSLDIIGCVLENCYGLATTLVTSSSEHCLICLLSSVPSPNTLFWCTAAGTPEQRKLMNRPGLLVLSRKPLIKPEFVDFFPETVEVFTRVNLMDIFNSYTEQNQFEIERLVDDFGSEKRVVLLGDINAGPDGPDGVFAEAEENYVLLKATFDTVLADGCTMCPDNVFSPGRNIIIDHVFGKGISISDVKRVFTIDDSTLYSSTTGDTIPFSDHIGVQATITQGKWH